MSGMDLAAFDERANPLDLVEALVAAQDWAFERLGEDELSACVSGAWCDYNLGVAWRPEAETIALTASFDFRIPRERRAEVYALLGLVNERLWIGHFDLASDEGLILFRHGLLLSGGARATVGQCENVLKAGVEACERYYPAFQFVLWGGKSAEEAIAASILDVAGEA